MSLVVQSMISGIAAQDSSKRPILLRSYQPCLEIEENKSQDYIDTTEFGVSEQQAECTI